MPTTSALTNSEVPLVTHCILDSGPIIKGQVKYHLASKFYTIPQVIREIKDAQSRLLLETLPFEIVVRQPTEESLAAGMLIFF